MSSTNSANSSEVTLAARMKSYEDTTRLPKGGVIIRVDGKAFHTWTKRNNFEKPFDKSLMAAMEYATVKTAMEMQGFRLAYTQSDEASFVLTNYGEMEGAWFDYKVQKLVSVTSSIFTKHFNKYFEGSGTTLANFDARAFSVPKFDLANNIVWRVQDNKRNWVQALGQHHFSHKQMQGKSNKEVLEMLEDHGIDLAEIPTQVKMGTTVYAHDGYVDYLVTDLDYDKINELIGIEKPGVWGDDAYRIHEDLEDIYADLTDEDTYMAEQDCN